MFHTNQSGIDFQHYPKKFPLFLDLKLRETLVSQEHFVEQTSDAEPRHDPTLDPCCEICVLIDGPP